MSKLKFYLLALGFSLVVPFLSLAEDTITITTYYPSPYGAYNKLQSNKLAVGDTNDDSEMTSSDQPPANGQIYTARSIILKPQSSLPGTDLIKGEVAYNNADNKLYSYDGSAWAAVGGGLSGSVTALSAEAGPDTFPNAAAYCRNLSAAAAVSLIGDTSTTYTDWRLPTISELAVFVGAVTSTRYAWTASTSSPDCNSMFLYNSATGYPACPTYTSESYYIRCVR